MRRFIFCAAVLRMERLSLDGISAGSSHKRARLSSTPGQFFGVGRSRSGQIYDPPEQDIKTGEWKYRIEGHTADGQWLVIVFCFRATDQTFLITVWSVERGRKR